MEEKLPKKKKVLTARGELMRALDITEEELIANAEGYLTDHQRATLLSSQRYRSRVSGVLGRVFGLLGLGFLVVGGVLYLTDVVPVVPLVFGLLGTTYALLGAGYVGVQAYQRNRIQQDIETNAPQTIQGIAVININEKQRTGLLEIGGRRLHASPEVLRRVRNMEPYVAYYLPDTLTLVALEHIDPDAALADAADRLGDVGRSDSATTAGDIDAAYAER